MSNSSTAFRANQKLIESTEIHLSKELKTSSIGRRVVDELAASTDRNPSRPT